MSARDSIQRSDSLRQEDSTWRAQNEPPKLDSIRFRPNSIFLEVGGTGILLSLNYDRRIADRFAFRIGFGAYYFGSAAGFLVPITASYLIPLSSFRSAHSIELGAGLSPSTSQFVDGLHSEFHVIPSLIAGYRYQPYDAGEIFRLSLTPFLVTGNFQIWGGISVGWTF